MINILIDRLRKGSQGSKFVLAFMIAKTSSAPQLPAASLLPTALAGCGATAAPEAALALLRRDDTAALEAALEGALEAGLLGGTITGSCADPASLLAAGGLLCAAEEGLAAAEEEGLAAAEEGGLLDCRRPALLLGESSACLLGLRAGGDGAPL